MVEGKPGQFAVTVNGQVVAGRGGGFWARLLGGGWPDANEVVKIVRATLQAAS